MQENNNIIIREADPGDIDDICRLLALLFDQETDFEPDYSKQKRGVSEIISDPHKGMFFVMEVSGRIAGCVSLLFLVSTAMGGKAAILEDMIIEADVRGRGLGSLLLEKVIRFAKKRGCSRLTVLTDGGNQTAQALYRKHGFKASAMTPMRLLF
jgi:GNAT superfamily N-acetyltransferase